MRAPSQPCRKDEACLHHAMLTQWPLCLSRRSSFQARICHVRVRAMFDIGIRHENAIATSVARVRAQRGRRREQAGESVALLLPASFVGRGVSEARRARCAARRK